VLDLLDQWPKGPFVKEDGELMLDRSYVDFWCMEGKEGRAYPAG
jgi:hypothetical protein